MLYFCGESAALYSADGSGVAIPRIHLCSAPFKMLDEPSFNLIPRRTTLAKTSRGECGLPILYILFIY